MKPNRYLFAITLAAGVLVGGCDPPVPTNPKPANGANPYVSGTPEERIKRIEADSSLTAEEKARRIAVVKQRNNLK